MTTPTVYDRLADALDALPNGFPRLESGIEILVLKKIYSEEEAQLSLALSGEMEPISVIAECAGLPLKETRGRLMKLSKRGLAWFERGKGEPKFRLAPFVVGIYEERLHEMDHEFAHLFEEYMIQGGAAGMMQVQPALQRVLPAQGRVKSEWILPYDDVRAVIKNAERIRVRECICRHQQEHLGKGCDAPMEVCMTISTTPRAERPEDISKEQALAILDQSEKAGLVHTVSNVAEGIGYICNCCGCCCSILRGITQWGLDKSVAHANYLAVVEADKCTGCGACVRRCQVDAIVLEDGLATVTNEKCIGCGLCATACGFDAVEMQRKPDDEIVHPPADYGEWEKMRRANRGMS